MRAVRGMTVVLLAPGAIGNVEIVVAIEIRGKDLESRDSDSGVRISCPDCLYIKHEAVRRAAGRRPSTVENPVLSRLTGFEDCSQQVAVCKNERQTAVGKKSRTPPRGAWCVRHRKGFCNHGQMLLHRGGSSQTQRYQGGIPPKTLMLPWGDGITRLFQKSSRKATIEQHAACSQQAHLKRAQVPATPRRPPHLAPRHHLYQPRNEPGCSNATVCESEQLIKIRVRNGGWKHNIRSE